MHGCVIDIESTALEAVGPGFILCAVIKPLNGKPVTLRYDELKDHIAHEKHLITAIFQTLSHYELWIGHNIENFDWPMLKSRALVLEVPFIQPGFIFDTFQSFKRSKFRTVLNCVGRPSAGLGHVVDFFAFKQQKTCMYPQDHWRTVWEMGKERKAAMNELVAHCVADVVMTEKIYWELLHHDQTAVIRRAK